MRIIPISHGYEGQADYTVCISFFDDQPIVIIQDPKHLLKALKNNLSLGAHFLTFPNDPVIYGQLVELAFSVTFCYIYPYL